MFVVSYTIEATTRYNRRRGPCYAQENMGNWGKSYKSHWIYLYSPYIISFFISFAGTCKTIPCAPPRVTDVRNPRKQKCYLCIGIVWLRRFVDLEDGVKPHDFQSYSNSLYIHPFICHSNSSNGTSFTSCPIKKQKGGSKEAHLSVNVGFHMSFGDETSIHGLRL